MARLTKRFRVFRAPVHLHPSWCTPHIPRLNSTYVDEHGTWEVTERCWYHNGNVDTQPTRPDWNFVGRWEETLVSTVGTHTLED